MLNKGGASAVRVLPKYRKVRKSLALILNYFLKNSKKLKPDMKEMKA
jgi:hypothetical protein